MTALRPSRCSLSGGSSPLEQPVANKHITTAEIAVIVDCLEIQVNWPVRVDIREGDTPVFIGCGLLRKRVRTIAFDTKRPHLLNSSSLDA